MSTGTDDLPAWASPYIGIPYASKGRAAELDCWGLVRRVLGEQYGICLPGYDFEYLSSTHTDSVEALIAREIGAWRPVMQPQAFDLVLLRIAGRVRHCALMLGPRWMIHTLAGTHSVREEIDGARWRHRVEGVYRHARLT